ncbi:MAG: thioredoxin family protein [Cyanobacteriota bacterium]|nr:thioredoxin family protein [Cyanobacteriota bacterium]
MKGTEIGSYAPDFELPGIDGTVHHLARYLETSRAVVVVFICNDCPQVKSYLDRLKQLSVEWSDRQIPLIAINPNDASHHPAESLENMGVFKATHDLNFAYIRDVTQEVATCFGATKTPEAFVLDGDGILRYRGAIDDSADTGAVKTPYLKQAIAQLLAGESIEIPQTDPVGCPIQWKK